MPRKPRQQRSRATVDAIVEAGFLCVARHGVANTTTRHIADAAGIGVGSLYEYFENKEAVFDAMNRRFVDDIVVLVQEMAPRMLDREIEPAIALLFDRFSDFLTADNERYLKVARQVVQADTREYIAPVSKALTDLLMQYVMTHPELMRLKNLPTMAYIMVNASIFTVLHHLSSDNPPITFAQLRSGLADLVNSWVAQNLPATTSSRKSGRGRAGRAASARHD